MYSISCLGGDYDNEEDEIPISEGFTVDNTHGGPTAVCKRLLKNNLKIHHYFLDIVRTFSYISS